MSAPAPSPDSTLAVHTVTMRNMAGEAQREVDLPAEVFSITPNLSVLHQVITAQRAAARAGTQSTKTRAEVRGGGAKPFRQKGTGRARQGSTRSPLWTGGGIALGPKPRSYRQRTPKKMVRLALNSALSDRAMHGRVALVDEWRFDVPKTKRAIAALHALGLEGRVLVVLGADEVEAQRSFANLELAQVALQGELCAHDVIRNEWVVFSQTTLPLAPESGAAHDAHEIASVPETAPVPGADATETAATEAGTAEGDAAATEGDATETAATEGIAGEDD